MTSAVVRIDLRELHNPDSGRLDTRRIAEYLNVPLSHLAVALGKNYRTLYKTPDSTGVQPLLWPIKTSLTILTEALGDRATVLAWLNCPHPNLDMRTPLEVMLKGRADLVMEMLVRAAVGIPT